ncbi:protein EVI2B [Tachyglossus aculeatus]|uniref:protein EVI2B n=1 Tax=Tachyglossus aculeatus TaxID=9261 RepID=UPI0018F6F839|nr:protein EVI2B [Tachyglossus aculeatus]
MAIKYFIVIFLCGNVGHGFRAAAASTQPPLFVSTVTGTSDDMENTTEKSPGQSPQPARVPSTQPTQPAEVPSNKPTQLAGVPSDKPTQLAGISFDRPTQLAGNSFDKPTQLAGISFHKPTQLAGISSDKPTQLAGVSFDKPTQLAGVSSDKPTQLAGVSSDKPTQLAGVSSNKVTQPAEVSSNWSTQPTWVPSSQPTQPRRVPSIQPTQPDKAASSQPTHPAEAASSQPTHPAEAPSSQPTHPAEASSSRATQPAPSRQPTHRPAISISSTLPDGFPQFLSEANSKAGSQTESQYSNTNSAAALLIGIILTAMMLLIIAIVLWKCSRKPLRNDQTWAGRSPFADGDTPDIYMDNIRENEEVTKRTSIISLLPWKLSKNTLLADDLDIKLFESRENVESSNYPTEEEMQDPTDPASKDSADDLALGIPACPLNDPDLPPPPPSLVDLETLNSQECEPPNSLLQPGTSDLPRPLEDPNRVQRADSDAQESLPPPPVDPLGLPPAPESFNAQQDHATEEVKSLSPELETQSHHFPSPPDLDRHDLDETLPPPPDELL